MKNFFDQYNFNVNRGPHWEPGSSIPENLLERKPVRLIAYYLPQFHEIEENNRWWSSGFTEWTNATKAVPRYEGHYQPRLPADLGFYDLSTKKDIARQVELAKRGGIDAFCFHYYWFSGKRILETPLEIFLSNPDLKISFCINWANENWTKRWDGNDSDVLLEQKYRPTDDEAFAKSIIAAVKDPRYLKIDGRPLIMFYRPGASPDARQTVAIWRAVFAECGVPDPYIVMPYAFGPSDPRDYGMDGNAGFPPHNSWNAVKDDRSSLRMYDASFQGQACSYSALASDAATIPDAEYQQFPGVCPSWDNEARKPGRGFGFYGSTPKIYGAWLEAASRKAMRATRPDERIVFINAWNEWAEGAYLEPDRHFGHAYLAETRRTLERLNADSGPTFESCLGDITNSEGPKSKFRNRIVNFAIGKLSSKRKQTK